MAVSIQFGTQSSLFQNEIPGRSLLDPILQQSGPNVVMSVPVSSLLHRVHFSYCLLQIRLCEGDVIANVRTISSNDIPLRQTVNGDFIINRKKATHYLINKHIS